MISQFLLDVKEVEEDEGESEFPSYSDPGMLLFRVHEVLEKKNCFDRQWEVDVMAYSGSAFWIMEGTGVEWWLESYFTVEDIPAPGDYVVEGITGHYVRGEWGLDDDDEEWEFTRLRKATQHEIDTYFD